MAQQAKAKALSISDATIPAPAGDSTDIDKHASGGQGMIPCTQVRECSEPSFLGYVTFADGLRL